MLGRIVLFAALMLPTFCAGQAPSARPVLFVHGILGDSQGWGSPTDTQNLRGALIARLAGTPLGYANLNNYDVYYDGIAVLYSRTGNPQDDLLAVESIPSDARFFTIRFYSGNSADPFNIVDTANISILNKASELAHVLEAIAQITHVQDSIVVAHSQGGLVVRAYMENLGSDNPCREILYQSPCIPGQVQYAQTIAHVVTLDTPYGGGEFSPFVTEVVSLAALVLNTTPINAFELMPNSVVLRAINYQSGVAGILPQPLPPVTIDSVVSFLSDLGFACPDAPELTCFSDDIVDSRSQAIRQNIAVTQLTPNLTDVSNPISANDPQVVQARNTGCPPVLPDSPFPSPDNTTPPGVILHQISCVGRVTSTQDAIFQSISTHATGVTTTVKVVATVNGAPSTQPFSYSLINQGVLGTTILTGLPTPHLFTNVPLGSYTVDSINGGPSTAFTLSTVGFSNGVQIATNRLGLDTASGARVTDLIISINFTTITSNSPSVSTSPATNQQCDSAILNGTTNPNGNGVNAYFEWGANSQLLSFFTTLPQSINSSTFPVSFNFVLTGLTCNTTYFYRAVVDNGHGPVRGSILSFTTLATLPAPIPSAPPNNSSGISPTPGFAWSAIAGATSYRLIVATNAGALPRDPTSAVCGVGCVFNVTPASTTYTPGPNLLAAGATYFWEVHARSASQFGDWSAVSSFTTGSSLPNDFSLQVTPSTQAVNSGGTAAFGITTATTSGTAQSITFSAGNLPLGVTAVFTPNFLTSGSTTVLGLTTSPSTPAGNYSITITAAGAFSAHSSTVTLVVNTTTGSPAVTFSPASLAFSDQTQFTTGPSQLVNFLNTGTAPLQVLSIVGDNNFAVLNPCINTLPPGTRCTFSVAFDPSTTGPIDGKVQLFFVGPTSPAVLPLHGIGLAPAPTTGTIQVNGTVNGNPLPNTPRFSFGFSYKLTGPSNLSAGGAETFTALPGTYTISFSGSPTILTLSSVTPAATQNVAAGGVVTFTMNFTAPTDFGIPAFEGSFPNQVVPAGAAATYTVGVDIPPGNVATPINIQVFGAPPGASISFSPQPLQSGGAYTLTIGTSASTPPNAYTLSLSASDSTGLTRLGGNETTLVVTEPPNQPAQLLSVSSNLEQGNGDSSTTSAGGISADGRYVVFSSGASNLVPNITSVHQDIFVRDQLLGSTALVSVASDGGLSNQDSFVPSISANGRFVVFQSSADNLVPGVGAVLGTNAVYVRDLQLGVTERDDISTSGVPGNGAGFNAAISADGRYVAFESVATNLVPGVTGLQVYLRDRKTQQTALISRGIDGLPANSRAVSPAISADGRFISFVSDAANLTGTTFTGIQVFVRDMQKGENILASVSNDGSPSSGGLFVQSSSPALSADGRFVLFTSQATNLVPSVTTDFFRRIYRRDLQQGTTALVDEDALAIPLGSPSGFPDPTISADGRFVAFAPFGQILVRDMANNQSAAVSLASDGTAGDDISQYAIISTNGSAIAFTSKANNLVPNDLNGFADKFETANPLIGTPSARAISLDSAAVGGGALITGTISLSGPAPSSGATVLLSSNSSAAQVPSTVLIPAGQTAVSFPVSTSIVSQETLLTIVASYNGGSPFTILALDPAPAFSISPSNWDFGNQAVGIASSATTFTISNAGTATLNLNSIALAFGQVFTIAANSCGASLGPSLSCSVSVAFKPNSPNPASDSLQISFGSPQILRSVPLLGNGAVPVVNLAAGVLNYSNQVIQSNILAVATVTNLGNAALTGLTAKIAGTNASDFTIESDSCSGSVLQINNSCLITVGFSPKAIGSRTATLSLTDNATSSPQSISLNGTGTDFSFTPSANGSTSQTITAGQSATYNLQIDSANGFSGQVALACSGAPALAQCAVNPSVIDVNQSALPFTVTVKTSAPVTSAAAWRWSLHDPPILFCSILLAAGILSFVSLFRIQISRRAQIASVIFGILLITGCGGGGTGPTQNTGQPGTPRGTYTLIVNGTSGGQTRTLSLTLIVQ